MKILFYGTADISSRALKKLFDTRKHEIEVVTACDKPRGRGQKIGACEVKGLAGLLGLKSYQPEKVKAPEVLTDLKRNSYDLGVVVAYGQIMSKELIELPRLGTINLHFSLLPRYRGAAPYNWALINGEKVTGVTIMYVTEKLDSGDIIVKKEVAIGQNDNAGLLLEKLITAGTDLLLEAVDSIAEGTAQRVPQIETEATYFGKLPENLFKIDWTKSAIEIHNLVRGLAPRPGAYTFLKGKLVKLQKTSLNCCGDYTGKPGEIKETLKDLGWLVATGKGGLLVERIKPEGKGEMSVTDYMRGNSVQVGTIMEKRR